MEIIYELFNCPNPLANQLDTCNYRLFMPNMEGLDKELLSIINIIL